MADALKLESASFTSTSALAREVEYLLQHESDKIIVIVRREHLESLSAELESLRGLGRMKVMVKE